MTKAQVAQLLTIIASFDRRTVGESDVEAWHLILGDLDVEDCAQAVKDHYGERTSWLMPADIRTRATSTARRREGQRRIAELEAQIAAENPGAIAQRDLPAITVGQHMLTDSEFRAEWRRQQQAKAHAKQAAVEADATTRNAERDRMEQARAELEALREKAQT
jgi:hypothetical protein